jgi:hypothetical protein
MRAETAASCCVTFQGITPLPCRRAVFCGVTCETQQTIIEKWEQQEWSDPA